MPVQCYACENFLLVDKDGKRLALESMGFGRCKVNADLGLTVSGTYHRECDHYKQASNQAVRIIWAKKMQGEK